jgi:diacylglycerol kinase family enzyme
MATHLLVANPSARSGKTADRIDRARHWLEAAGIACDFLETQPGGDTIDAVRRAVDGGGLQCVVCMGGDGTFREVASGILMSTNKDDVAMGMLPTGTANDQGRSFGLSAADSSLEKNLEVILARNETRIDAGRLALNDRHVWFFDSAGWGIGARVLRERNVDRTWIQEKAPALGAIWRDQLVYAGALMRVFLESYVVSEKFAAHITTETGEKLDLDRLTDLVVKNTRFYAGAWVFDRESRPDDGLFEIIPFRGRRDWTSKAIVDLNGNLLSEDILNQVGIEHSKPFRASRIDISFTKLPGCGTLHAQIDGEELDPSDDVTIEVAHQALRLIVPRTHSTFPPLAYR